MVGAIHPILYRVEIDHRRAILAQQHNIVAFAVVQVSPDRPAREDLEKGRDLALDRVLVALVQRHPLRDDSTGIQVCFHQFEVLARVERGGAFHPRMDRVGRDDVEFLIGGEHEVAGIVVDDLHARILGHFEVLRAEIRADHPRDERLDFADHHPLHFGVRHERTRRDTGAESHDEHGTRIGMHERGQVAEQTLQAHVLRLRRRLDLSRDVEVAPAVAFQFTDGDGRIHSLAAIQLIDDVEPPGGLPPVGNQFKWHGRYAHDQRNGHDECTDSPACCAHDGDRGERGDGHQQLLRVLCADPRDEDDAERDGPDNAAHGIGRVDAAHELRAVPSL